MAETARDTEVENDETQDTSQDVAEQSVGSVGTEAQAVDTDAKVEAAPTFREIASQHGLDDLPEEPDKLVEYVARERQRARQLEQQNQFYGRSHAELQRLQDAERQKQSAAEKVQKKKWEAPKYDPAWSNFIGIDPDTGQPAIQEKFRSAVNPGIIDEYRKRKDFERQTFNTLIEDPHKFYEETGLYDTVQERVAKLVQEQFQEHASRQRAEQFMAQNQHWIVQGHDPVTGQAVLTPEGRIFSDALNRAARMGISNPADQEEFATRWLESEVSRSNATNAGPQSATGGLQQQNAGKKLDFQRRAAKAPNRSGAQNGKPKREAITSENFKQKFMERVGGIPEDSWGRVEDEE